MRKISLTVIIGIIVFYVPIKILFAEERSAEKDFAQDLVQAQTLDEFEQAAFSINEQRLKFVNSLIRMLRSETDTEKKVRICYLLGEYRATRAILELADNITLEAKIEPYSDKLPKWLKYPAQEALVKCGYRSIPYMLRNIESNDDKQITELSTRVIWQIIGEGLSRTLDGKDYARMIIEKRLNEQSDPAKKARLKSSLEYLK